MSGWILGALVLAASGCARPPADASSVQQHVAVANGSVELSFPAGWYKNPRKHPFDLQLFSKNDRMNTGVFLFAKEDLAEDLAPRELLARQIQDLRSKRRNFHPVELEQVASLKGKTLTSVVYSGDKDASRDYYRFTLIEFAENPALVAVAIQVSLPEYWRANKPVLEAITASARVTSKGSVPHR